MSTEIVYTSGVSKPYPRVTHYIMIAVRDRILYRIAKGLAEGQ